MAKKDRVGEVFVSNEGYEFIIIEYNCYSNVCIEFCDEYKVKIYTTYGVCKNGSIKNPYHKSICGVACVGLMSDGSKPKTRENGKDSREYKVWYDMVKRCYSSKYHEKNPSYKDCEVCQRWLVFANFLEDIKSIEGYELWRDNPNQRIALDKDIKSSDSKVYCLENCCFVTQSENSKERYERCGNSFGVQPTKVYGVNVKTGECTKVFNSINEASRELDIHISNISHCLNNYYGCKTVGGYKWFKVEEE